MRMKFWSVHVYEFVTFWKIHKNLLLTPYGGNAQLLLILILVVNMCYGQQKENDGLIKTVV